MKGKCDIIISLKNKKSALHQNAVHYRMLWHPFAVVLWWFIPSRTLKAFTGIQSCLRQILVWDWRRSGLEQGWLFSLLALSSLSKVSQDLVIRNISKGELNLVRIYVSVDQKISWWYPVFIWIVLQFAAMWTIVIVCCSNF